MSKYSDSLNLAFFNGLNFCIKQINKMKRTESHIFSIFICYTQERAYLEIMTGAKLIELIKPANLPKTNEELLKMLGE